MPAPDDMAASLPQPPPPAPARREAAIDAALRRFDGTDALPAASPQRTTPGFWTRLTRPQVGALVSAALVAVIGVPIAWLSFGQWSDTRPRPDAPVSVERQFEPQPETKTASPAPTQRRASAAAIATDELAQAVPPPVTDKDAREAGTAPAPAERQELARADAAPAAPPASAAPAFAPPAPERERDGNIVVTAKRRQETLQDVPMSVTVVGEEAGSRAAARKSERKVENEDRAIVVTSAQARNSLASRRGDWNACTLNDPDRNPRRCRNQEAGAAAAAFLTDGLSHAWKGDLSGAIAAFDQAIAKSPRYALAYLNRGLAHQRMGDTDRAIADLDQAVRFDPGAARNHYVRSQLFRAEGNDRRARADERRAVEIDPGYADLLR